MGEIKIRLKKLFFKEMALGQLDIEIRESEFSNFNLLMGDNAQGKTGIINKIRFLRDIHKGLRAGVKPGGKIEFDLLFDVEGSEDTIRYKFDISLMPDGVTPNFSEEIYRNSNKLFSRRENIFIDEGQNASVANFFLPTHVPAITSINVQNFVTINALKSFFDRILLLEANRLDSRNIEIGQSPMFLGDQGRNAASVLDQWKKSQPSLYKEVVSEFQEVFSFVAENSIVIKIQPIQGTNISAPLLFYKEKENGKEIVQADWSDGMLRTICLIMLPLTRFVTGPNAFLRPSLLLVDEIENGLDFNALGHLMNFYEGFSSQIQMIITSHSPTVCNFVSPEKWRIVRRKGSTIQSFSPGIIEKDLDAERKKLLKDNWEFYRRHIAKSKLYSVH